MIEVRVNIEVALPPQEVFDYWSDHANNPSWQQGMVSCTWTSEPPIGVGSTYDQVAKFLGFRIVSTFECVEHEPGTMIRMRTTKSTMPLDITRRVEPTPSGGTALTAIIRGEPKGIAKLFDPLTRRMVERNVNQDYGRLKELLDGRAGAGTAPS